MRPFRFGRESPFAFKAVVTYAKIKQAAIFFLVRYYQSSALAIFSITAHSILFLKSSQPYLYTPPIEPVA